jgi:hypothetical protein
MRTRPGRHTRQPEPRRCAMGLPHRRAHRRLHAVRGYNRVAVRKHLELVAGRLSLSGFDNLVRERFNEQDPLGRHLRSQAKAEAEQIRADARRDAGQHMEEARRVLESARQDADKIRTSARREADTLGGCARPRRSGAPRPVREIA